MYEIKILTKHINYAILLFMKKFFLLFYLLFSTVSVSFALDTVQSKDSSLEGKIFSYSDGLIQIRCKGVEYKITRSKKSDYFGDYIKYRNNPLSSDVVETYGRLSFVDLYTVVFLTPDSRITIPRYRVQALILDTN